MPGVVTAVVEEIHASPIRYFEENRGAMSGISGASLRNSVLESRGPVAAFCLKLQEIASEVSCKVIYYSCNIIAVAYCSPAGLLIRIKSPV
jgi:hypothetical protein